MKALIILNLEDCTFDEIEEAEIKEISLIYEDKETGKKYDFLWETGFKIKPMPKRIPTNEYGYMTPYGSVCNDCIDEILGGQDSETDI